MNCIINKKITIHCHIAMILFFSEIDEPPDFNETLINGSVLNVVSMNNIFFGNHYLKSYQHLKFF